MAEQRSLIRKHIDALSEHGWLAGESFSDYRMEKYRTNTYSNSSISVDPFRKLGTIQAGVGQMNPTTVTGLPNQVLAMKTYFPITNSLFALDIRNNVFYVDTSFDRASLIQSLNATTITNQSNGLEVHRDALYVAHNLNATIARLAKFSPLSNNPTWNLSYNMSLTAYVLNAVDPQSAPVPQITLSWKGNLYVMHGNKVNYITGNETSPVILTVGCTLPDSMIIRTACNFGTLIAIGASDVLTGGTNKGNCKVYLYDGFSLDWQKEISFYDNDITNLIWDGKTLFADGPKGKWEYDGIGFNRLGDLDAPVVHNGADVNNGLLYFHGVNVVRAYGRPNPLIEKAWIRPINGIGNQGIIKWVSASKIYAASNDGNVYRFSTATWNTNAVFLTRFIDAGAGQLFYLRAIKVSYEGLASGDSIAVSIDDENGNGTVIANITFTVDGTNSPTSKLITENDFLTAINSFTRLRVRLALNAGQPKITAIDLLLETAKEI